MALLRTAEVEKQLRLLEYILKFQC